MSFQTVMRDRALAYGLMLLTALIVAACAALGGPTGGTFNNQAANMSRGITATRIGLTALTAGRQVTPERDEIIQAQLTVIETALKYAKSVQAADPAGALAQVNSLSAQLTAIKAGLPAPPPVPAVVAPAPAASGAKS